MKLNEAYLHGLDYKYSTDINDNIYFKSFDNKYEYLVYCEIEEEKELFKKNKFKYVYLKIIDLITGIDITFSNKKVIKLWNTLLADAEAKTEKMMKEFEFIDGD